MRASFGRLLPLLNNLVMGSSSITYTYTRTSPSPSSHPTTHTCLASASRLSKMCASMLITDCRSLQSLWRRRQSESTTRPSHTSIDHCSMRASVSSRRLHSTMHRCTANNDGMWTCVSMSARLRAMCQSDVLHALSLLDASSQTRTRTASSSSSHRVDIEMHLLDPCLLAILRSCVSSSLSSSPRPSHSPTLNSHLAPAPLHSAPPSHW